jgi:large subunit ribosomal protein L30e
MADLANNIRLAVDSGKVALGVNKVMDSIRENNAKLIVVAAKNKPQILQDIQHITKVSNIKTLTFDGNSVELGAVCGKPYSVSVLAVIEEGHSKIFEEQSA